MENFTIRVAYTDGSSLTKNVYADNFGQSCSIIYNESRHSAFILSFTNITKGKLK